MSVLLDHAIVPSHDPVTSARLLAELLDVPWEPARGHFTPVYVNESLTLDFDSREGFDRHHFCFHVTDEEFDRILGRIQERGMAYRSEPRGANDMQVNTRLGGKDVYWQDDDGHVWEVLTVSYARVDSPALA